MQSWESNSYYSVPETAVVCGSVSGIGTVFVGELIDEVAACEENRMSAALDITVAM